MSRVVIGTAGHIDHGKSALVRALTGTDPDRLPEEKRRGITIDLGFAFLDDVAAIIDVPGHEKFIRNMVAGAATVDFAILVVAADDGVMPQTTEHLHILRLLGISNGCIALTKADIADSQWLALVEEQIRSAVRATFLEATRLFVVDSLSGRGIAEFRTFLENAARQLQPRTDRGLFRLPIDRVFTVKGRGTVVTGTVLTGTVSAETRVVALPIGVEFRVKQIESHSSSVQEVRSGQRAALNLLGDTDRIERGQTIALPGALISTHRISAQVELLPGAAKLRDRQRVRVLIGTDEAIARVQWSAPVDSINAVVQFKLESPIVAAWGDRFILRRYSPVDTLGGGIVLDPLAQIVPARSRPALLESLKLLATGDLSQAVRAYAALRADTGLSVHEIAQVFGVPQSRIRELSSRSKGHLAEIAGSIVPNDRIALWESQISKSLELALAASSGTVGISPGALQTGELRKLPSDLFEALITRLAVSGKLVREGGLLRFPERRIMLTNAQEKLISTLDRILKESGFAPPSAAVLAERTGSPRPEVEKTLVLMERIGKCRRLGVDLFFDRGSFESAIASISAALPGSSGLSVADVSKLLSSSRKYVVPFLEHLDSRGITERKGDVRIAGRLLKASPGS